MLTFDILRASLKQFTLSSGPAWRILHLIYHNSKKHQLLIPISSALRDPCLVIESKGYPDAEEIQENIDFGKIHVSGYSSQEKGEVESLRLYRLGGFELIASDDRKFLNSLEKYNIPYLTSSSLIVYLFHKKRLTGKDTIKYIDSLKAHISNDQYLTAISEVLRWER